MLIIKPGNKKFVYACKEKIFEVTCNYCGAVLEMQEGELELWEQRFTCPYCGKYHSDYTTRYLRTETMNLKDVRYPDPVRNPQWETTEKELEKAREQELKERLAQMGIRRKDQDKDNDANVPQLSRLLDTLPGCT